MKFLRKGEFFGISKKIAQYNGLTITETLYPSPVCVPWHYHENPHFTFFLKGHVLEASKKEAFHCTPGSLIFHNCQEAHYDTKHSENMHYFHVEFDNKWLGQHFTFTDHEGHAFFNHPTFRRLFHQIYREFRISDSLSQLAIEGVLLQVFCEMKRFEERLTGETPDWMKKLKAFMLDNCAQPISLDLLSKECGRSPVYLSQIFPKYFKATFGEYVRKIRIDKATSLLSKKTTHLQKSPTKQAFPIKVTLRDVSKKYMESLPQNTLK